MEVNQIIIFITTVIFILTLAEFILDRKSNKNIPSAASPKKVLPYAECLIILNQVIEEVMKERMFMLSFSGKITIPPLDEEMINMTNVVLDSLSDEFIDNMLQYVTMPFLTRYIGRIVRDYCMEYIENVRLKK